MSDDSWNKRKKALEDDFFRKEEQEKLKNLAEKPKKRLSPITGEPMGVVNFHGVEIDVCKTSGGIWLDHGEFEKIISQMKEAEEKTDESWLEKLMKSIEI